MQAAVIPKIIINAEIIIMQPLHDKTEEKGREGLVGF
jgi:hypothetical protein